MNRLLPQVHASVYENAVYMCACKMLMHMGSASSYHRLSAHVALCRLPTAVPPAAAGGAASALRQPTCNHTVGSAPASPAQPTRLVQLNSGCQRGGCWAANTGSCNSADRAAAACVHSRHRCCAASADAAAAAGADRRAVGLWVHLCVHAHQVCHADVQPAADAHHHIISAPFEFCIKMQNCCCEGAGGDDFVSEFLEYTELVRRHHGCLERTATAGQCHRDTLIPRVTSTNDSRNICTAALATA